MLKGISYVIETNSEAERSELREFIFSRKMAASFIYGGDGYQLIAIATGDVWYLATTDEERIKSYQFDRFSSVKEFIKFYNKKGL